MATEALVGEEIRQGRLVVEALEEAVLPFRAAMWYFAPQYEDWRLLIATPLLRKLGPRKAYERVERLLSRREETRGFPLNRIWLVEDDFPVLDMMAKSLHITRKKVVQFSEEQVLSHSIKDAHIYRLSA